MEKLSLGGFFYNFSSIVEIYFDFITYDCV